MRHIEIFQVDAFTDKVFHGNPAAVCLLDTWLNDELMQAIAVENNLSETAFIIEDKNGFHIRWFTPRGEITLCGHATLAAGYVIYELGKNHNNHLEFISVSGPVTVERKGNRYILNFPCMDYYEPTNPALITALINKTAVTVFESELDYLVLLSDQKKVEKAQVDLQALAALPKRGLILTSSSNDADFYARCFYPKQNIAEDPVTGSAYGVLAPFWAERLNKQAMRSIQGLFRRGEVFCNLLDDRVFISGNCRFFLKGHLVI